jgi:CheY-like chemotaxis protein
MNERRIRVVVVDDIAEIRENIRKLLQFEPDMEVVATGANGVQAIELYAELRPDVVSMNIYMPKMDGITATNVICRRHPDAGIFMLSVVCDTYNLTAAACSGALAALAKPPRSEDLIATVRTVAQKRSVSRPRDWQGYEVERFLGGSPGECVEVPGSAAEVAGAIVELGGSLREMSGLAHDIAERMRSLDDGAERIGLLCLASRAKLADAETRYREIRRSHADLLKGYEKTPMCQIPKGPRALFDLRYIIDDAARSLERIDHISACRRHWQLSLEEYSSLIQIHSLLAQRKARRLAIAA